MKFFGHDYKIEEYRLPKDSSSDCFIGMFEIKKF